ncbi:MAG: 4-alpha-glucanotransferase [Chthoniobacteraceae bacterium]
MTLTPEKPIAGLLAPLFALRREGDLGIGDTAALREFIDWAAEHAFKLVQLLPINETGNDHSPYNAISSVAIDPTTITLTPAALPDLSEADVREVMHGIDPRVLHETSVAYNVVKPLKLRLLARAFANFSATSLHANDERARAFRRFCREESAWLDDFALFRVLIDENAGSEQWDTWPGNQRDAVTAWQWLATLPGEEQERFARALHEVQYRQWIAWTQWREVKAHAESRGVVLMGDIPFGVSLYSADAWANPGMFDLEWFGGCPPEKILEVDAFTKKWGQNWGIPLYRWDAHRADGYAWWRQRVRKVRDIFHLFRIDHILGVFRIYSFPWRPVRNEEFLPLTEEEAGELTGGKLPHFTPHEDDTDEHKAANCAQGEELLRVLIDECGENRLIGEDLGVVPDYVRPCLARLGIAGFKIPQWECEPDGRLIDGAKYERLSLATYATHDHEPLRAMWEKWMLTIHAAESGGPETWPARDQAWREVRALAAWCDLKVFEHTPWGDAIHERLLYGLMRCKSWLVVLMITDLFATTQRFNVPGAVSGLNWSTRLHGTATDWRRDLIIREQTARIATLVRACGRG